MLSYKVYDGPNNYKLQCPDNRRDTGEVIRHSFVVFFFYNTIKYHQHFSLNSFN